MKAHLISVLGTVILFSPMVVAAGATLRCAVTAVPEAVVQEAPSAEVTARSQEIVVKTNPLHERVEQSWKSVQPLLANPHYPASAALSYLLQQTQSQMLKISKFNRELEPDSRSGELGVKLQRVVDELLTDLKVIDEAKPQVAPRSWKDRFRSRPKPEDKSAAATNLRGRIVEAERTTIEVEEETKRLEQQYQEISSKLELLETEIDYMNLLLARIGEALDSPDTSPQTYKGLFETLSPQIMVALENPISLRAVMNVSLELLAGKIKTNFYALNNLRSLTEVIVPGLIVKDPALAQFLRAGSKSVSTAPAFTSTYAVSCFAKDLCIGHTLIHEEQTMTVLERKGDNVQIQVTSEQGSEDGKVSYTADGLAILGKFGFHILRNKEGVYAYFGSGLVDGNVVGFYPDGRIVVEKASSYDRVTVDASSIVIKKTSFGLRVGLKVYTTFPGKRTEGTMTEGKIVGFYSDGRVVIEKSSNYDRVVKDIKDVVTQK